MIIETVEDLEVGDIGFSVISGRTGGGIALGQALIDVVNLLRGRKAEQAWFSHAFIVAHKGEDSSGPYATIIEAMPRGSRTWYLRGKERIGEPGFGWARLPITDAQRVHIAVTAVEYINVPYSFADYLSIALLHMGLPRTWLAKYIQSSGHMICSQLVDHIFFMARFSIFEDGRMPADVTPGALFHRAGALGEVVWW